jgi:glycosyltransferase involved in cell wall biosynthesis
MARKIAVILKGYPRLSETFIAQELLGLERAGFDLVLLSMRHPTDKKRHPVHDEVKAPVGYLPEYLHDEPWRVIKSWWRARHLPGYRQAFRTFLQDLGWDFSRNRFRRFGQALVLSADLDPGVVHLHAHFLHTPASVASYVSMITGLRWTCSAHAKDIWTSADRELEQKLSRLEWIVTCTRVGFDKLKSLAHPPDKVHLSYHGLDLTRFGRFTEQRNLLDGSNAAQPVKLLSVGRAVEKKGYDTLLEALALLPENLSWAFIHIGGGELLGSLRGLAERLGLTSRIEWKGALAQDEVLVHYRSSDLFVLACRIASDGDRDGLPNVLVEASSQALACVSTDISGVPELLSDGKNGWVVPPEDPRALAKAIEAAILSPQLRGKFGRAAEERVRREFDHETSIVQLTRLFESIGVEPRR